MSIERDQALGRKVFLDKEIFELGIKASSLVDSINKETKTFMAKKDFMTINWTKVESLAVELQKLQNEFREKCEERDSIKEIYGF